MVIDRLPLQNRVMREPREIVLAKGSGLACCTFRWIVSSQLDPIPAVRRLRLEYTGRSMKLHAAASRLKQRAGSMSRKALRNERKTIGVGLAVGAMDPFPLVKEPKRIC